MRCHKCDEGVLTIRPITSPEVGWFVECNKCVYHARIPTADQMATAQPMTAPTKIKWKIKWIPQRESSYQGLSEHPLDCSWHKDWHACDCGLFDNKEEEE
jgi:hypothetical protein